MCTYLCLLDKFKLVFAKYYSKDMWNFNIQSANSDKNGGICHDFYSFETGFLFYAFCLF